MRNRKQRSLHCSPAEQDAIRARAREAGKKISHYVIERVLADDPVRHPLALTPEEQREQLEMLLRCDMVMRMLWEELPGGCGVSLFEAMAVLEREFGK